MENRVYSANVAPGAPQNAAHQHVNPYHRLITVKTMMFSLGYGVLVLADLIMLAVGVHYGPHATSLGIAGVGLLSFFGIIGLVNGATGDGSLNNGEIRKAITGAFLTVYLTIVALTFVSHYRFELQNDFTYLVGGIIMFYFGSSTFRDYMAVRNGRSADSSINTPAAPDWSDNRTYATGGNMTLKPLPTVSAQMADASAMLPNVQLSNPANAAVTPGGSMLGVGTAATASDNASVTDSANATGNLTGTPQA